ncbi:MAG: hypothetical protein U1B78_03265, partial [Dehalococcoidia bacterium]|nr:hypothetical protein [Dehalococcoidia bacterium]
MMRNHARPVALAAAALVLAAVLLGCDALTDNDDEGTAEVTGVAETTPGATPGASADAMQPGQTPPEEALRLFVQRRLNQGFVPNCDDAKRPDDIGKQCARLRAERDGLLAFELGPTFAEYTRLLILQPVDGTWTIVHSETRDLSQPPPEGIPWPL